MTIDKPNPNPSSPSEVKQELTLIERLSQVREGRIVGVDKWTDEQEQEALLELMGLWTSDIIAFERRLGELKAEFGVPKEAIRARVKQLVEANQPNHGIITDDVIPDLLIDIALEHSALWHNRSRVGYATFVRDGHVEHHKIESIDYRDFLTDKFIQIYQENVKRPTYPRKSHIAEAIFQIEGHARRGKLYKPALRVTDYEGALWISRGDWTGLRVTADGWDIVPKLAAPLLTADGMLELPLPVREGNINDLRQFTNFENEDDFVLFCGNLAIILNPFGKQLTSIFCGPPGSGKTTATMLLRALTDPNENATRRYAGVRNMMHGVANTYVLALENVSEIDDELSDTICALNTGTGYSERKYYAQGVEFSIGTVIRPIVINGIPTGLASRPDLIDRLITIPFDHLGDAVRSDDMFWQDFEQVAPGIFGALLDGLVGAMAMRRKFKGNNNDAWTSMIGGPQPRFSDGLVWAEAACRAMGFAPGWFIQAYRNNKTASLRRVAEADQLCIAVRKLSEKHPRWQGTPTDLCDDLPRYGFTGSPIYISRQLGWITGMLHELYGISVKMGKRLKQNDNRNGIIIENLGVGRGHLPELLLGPGADISEPTVEPKPQTLGLKRRV